MGLILTFKNLVWESHTIQVCPLLYLSGTLSRGPLRPGKRYIMRCVGELFLHCCHNDDKRELAAAPNIHIANITFAVSDKSWCTIALLQFFVRPRGQKKDKRTLAKKTPTTNKQTKPNLKHVKTPAVLAWHSPASASPTFGTWDLKQTIVGKNLGFGDAFCFLT